MPRKDVDSELAFEFSKNRVLLQLCVSLCKGNATILMHCIALRVWVLAGQIIQCSLFVWFQARQAYLAIAKAATSRENL